MNGNCAQAVRRITFNNEVELIEKEIWFLVFVFHN